MAAPIWQYITILVFFSLGAVLNVLSIGLMAFVEKNTPELLTAKRDPISFGKLLLRTLMSVFAGYLTWTLYQYAPGALSLGILVTHWASLVVGYVVTIAEAGKTKTYGYGQHIFATIYCTAVLGALITYGVQCL